MDTIHIQASTAYDVIIERHSLPRISKYLHAIKPLCSVMIVTDDNVAPLYASTVSKSLETAGYTVHTYTFPHGESEKNGHRLMDLIETLGTTKLTRKDLIILSLFSVIQKHFLPYLKRNGLMDVVKSLNTVS